MIAHLGPHRSAIGVGDDQVRSLHRHVAIHAASRYLAAQRFEPTAALHLVTAKAALRKCRRIALRLMHVMTGDAGHGSGLLIAAAPLQQRHLVAMHVEPGRRIWTW